MTIEYASSTADLSQWVLDTALQALTDCNREPITTAYVGAGVPSWDDCCGTLVVTPEQVFLSQTFPAPFADRVICDDGYVAVTLSVLLVRCAPVVDDRGRAPSAAAMNAAYQALLEDAAVIQNAMMLPLPDDEWMRTTPTQSFVGAQGGCIGVETRFTLGVPQSQWLVCCSEPVPHVPGGPICRQNASVIVFEPCEGLVSTNVQDAICELAAVSRVYGGFYSDVDQSAALNTPTPMTLNVTTDSAGVSIVAGSQITVTQDAVIDVQFSVQFHHRGGGGSGEIVTIWLAKNGQPVTESATNLHVTSNRYVAAAWDWLVSLQAGEHVEIMWSTQNTRIVMEHIDAAPPIPSVPSLIVTVMQAD